MALTQQSDGTSYKKPIGNKNKGNGSKKQPTIPLPNMKQQTGQGANAQVGKSPMYNYISEWKAPGMASYSDWYEGGSPNLADKLDPNGVYQGMNIPMFGGNDANPSTYRGSRLDFINNMMQNGGRMNSDYDITESLIDNPLFGSRGQIDSRFPGDLTLEDILAYLQDDYAWLQPEETSQMTPGTRDPNGGGSGGYGGYGGSYIPMPDYSTWGGGGYGNNNGYRDSGLVNWRI